MRAKLGTGSVLGSGPHWPLSIEHLEWGGVCCGHMCSVVVGVPPPMSVPVVSQTVSLALVCLWVVDCQSYFRTTRINKKHVSLLCERTIGPWFEVGYQQEIP